MRPPVSNRGGKQRLDGLVPDGPHLSDLQVAQSLSRAFQHMIGIRQ